MDTPDEPSLISAAARGDKDAFSSLVRLHQAAVRGFVGRWCNDAEAAEDIAQEVFIAAFDTLPRFEGRSTFRTWLLSLARHKALDWLRSASRRREVDVLAATISAWQAEELAATGEDDADAEITALRACVERLPASSARLVRALYAGGSHAEISDRHRVSQSALRVTLFRLRQILRACVERRLAAGGRDG